MVHICRVRRDTGRTVTTGGSCRVVTNDWVEKIASMAQDHEECSERDINYYFILEKPYFYLYLNFKGICKYYIPFPFIIFDSH